jgi:hypothetical protein
MLLEKGRAVRCGSVPVEGTARLSSPQKLRIKGKPLLKTFPLLTKDF